MLFRDFLTPASIIGNLISTTRNEALAEMVDYMIGASLIHKDIRQGVLTALIEREDITSTGIGNSLAVPHGKHPAMKKLTGLVARSREGVAYNALDGKPVHLFVMLLSNQELVNQHLYALTYVATTFKRPEMTNFILNARDEKEIWKLLEEADQKVN